jgi:cytochrome b subunit of formate dehydrogenase
MDKYPGYAEWAAQLASRDNAFLFIIIVSGIVLLWVLYSKTIFKRIDTITRFSIVALFYLCLIGFQVMYGSAIQ